MMSSQSFALVHEYDIAVIGGNFNEASGMESVDAFFANEPAREPSSFTNVRDSYQ
jgi:hypothetical protein